MLIDGVYWEFIKRTVIPVVCNVFFSNWVHLAFCAIYQSWKGSDGSFLAVFFNFSLMFLNVHPLAFPSPHLLV